MQGHFSYGSHSAGAREILNGAERVYADFVMRVAHPGHVLFVFLHGARDGGIRLRGLHGEAARVPGASRLPVALVGYLDRIVRHDRERGSSRRCYERTERHYSKRGIEFFSNTSEKIGVCRLLSRPKKSFDNGGKPKTTHRRHPRASRRVRIPSFPARSRHRTRVRSLARFVRPDTTPVLAALPGACLLDLYTLLRLARGLLPLHFEEERAYYDRIEYVRIVVVRLLEGAGHSRETGSGGETPARCYRPSAPRRRYRLSRARGGGRAAPR